MHFLICLIDSTQDILNYNYLIAFKFRYDNYFMDKENTYYLYSTNDKNIIEYIFTINLHSKLGNIKIFSW